MDDLVSRARAFALERHAGQRRKGAAGEPYSVHLDEVAGLVEQLGGGSLVIAAAWLHDTVEDCPPTSIIELADLFGPEVAGMVAELTDDKALPKLERKRQQLLKAPSKSPGASLVKLCDKTSNIRAIALSPPADWPTARQREYLEWAHSVVNGLPGLTDGARAIFADAIVQAEAAIARRLPIGD